MTTEKKRPPSAAKRRVHPSVVRRLKAKKEKIPEIPRAPREQRRSLTHVGGEAIRGGDPEKAELLAQALDVAPAGERDDEPERAHVHGFHPYPARMHPDTAKALVASFSDEGATVLDPFCGSGTVLVEAMIQGRRAIGTDLNPFAVRLAMAKTHPRKEAERAALLETAQSIADLANERRTKKAGATHRYPHDDVRLFEPHVLLELDSLRLGIAEKEAPTFRPDLSLVLSAILVKVSRKRGDTSLETERRRIAAGYTTKLFVKKTEELVARHETLTKLFPSPVPKVFVAQADAKNLKPVDANVADTVITSPPYAATYDYVEHHDLRMRWLGMDRKQLEQEELGARRHYAELNANEATERWCDELDRFFKSLARVTKAGANVVLLMADSAVGRTALRADTLVDRVATAGKTFTPLARASQTRPHFHPGTQAAFRDTPRFEHALLLVKR